MNEFHFSLLTDGPSDVVLLPILRWLLNEHLPTYGLQGTWADTRPFHLRTLEDRITQAINYYPCDMLFIHRDAEKEPAENRYKEVYEALQRLKQPISVPVVCVVPVRMQEAWLLFDEAAIRYAAGNPNGKVPISLPSLLNIEGRPDPKEDLYSLLKQASGLQGRRLKKFSETDHARNVTRYIEDFSPLRSLSAFQNFEMNFVKTLKTQGWINE